MTSWTGPTVWSELDTDQRDALQTRLLSGSLAGDLQALVTSPEDAARVVDDLVVPLAATPADPADPVAWARARRAAEQVAVTLLDVAPPAPVTPAPTLSVVVTAHNVGPWMRETLDSILGQTFSDLEVLLVVDHATDETDDVVATYDDPRLRVIRPVLRGGAHARNVGLTHARGTWLVFCDGDDIVPETAYASLVAQATDDVDIVFGQFLKFSPTKTWSPTSRWPAYDESRRSTTLDDQPSLIRHRACWNKLFRRSFWTEHDPVYPEVVRSNDVHPMVTAYLAAGRVAVTTDVVYLYRERPGRSSMTSKIGSSASLSSYMKQELACRALVELRGSEPVTKQYVSMVLNADGWVQTTKWLAQCEHEAPDPEMAEEVIGFISAYGVERIAKLPAGHRLVLGHLAAHDLDRAIEAFTALNHTPAEIGTAAWLRRWTAVLAHLPESEDEILPSRAKVVAKLVNQRLDKATRSLADDDTRDVATALAELLTASRIPTDFPAVAHRVDTSLSGAVTALLAGDVDDAAVRMTIARVVTADLVSDTSTSSTLDVVLTVAGESDGSVRPVALAKISAAGPVSVAALEPGADGSWTGSIKAEPLGRSAVVPIAVQLDVDGSPVLVPLAARDRTIGLTHGRKARLQLERRPGGPELQLRQRRHWVVRGATTALRRVLRRLRAVVSR